MSYNRYNYLLRVKQVNEVYREHSCRGIFTEHIYRNYIRPRFYISRQTFYSYLTIPYARELAKFQAPGASLNSV